MLLGSLPASIGQLNKLQELKLENNQIEKLPPQISGLVELRVMDLSHNSLEDLPDMSKLTGLLKITTFVLQSL